MKNTKEADNDIPTLEQATIFKKEFGGFAANARKRIAEIRDQINQSAQKQEEEGRKTQERLHQEERRAETYEGIVKGMIAIIQSANKK